MVLQKKLKKEILEYKKIIENLKFIKISNNKKLEHINNYASLCYAHREFDECWKYYRYNLLRQNKVSKYPSSIKDKNKKIKFLENIKDLKTNHCLLIWDDGGFGDLILHYRLLQLFPKNINFKIMLRNNLGWIFKKYKDKFITDDGLFNFDYHVSFMQLENLFKFKLKKYKFELNYLVSNEKHYWSDYFKKFKGKKIGLVIRTETSKHKNINFEELQFFLKKNLDKNFFLIDLNPNEEMFNYQNHFSNLFVLSDIDKNNPFEDTFNIIKKLDLLIGIDTAAVHLAGYLNIRTILLLNFPHHYYWGINEKSSIYYENFEIIRATKTNDWFNVIKNIKI